MEEALETDNNLERMHFQKFIAVNRKKMEEKYYQHFFSTDITNKQPFKQSTKTKLYLTHLQYQSFISYLLQVLSLQRYKQESERNTAIRKSVQKNLNEYLEQINSGELRKKEDLQLNFQRVLDILLFVIKKDQIFAIQYQKNTPLPKDKLLKEHKPEKEKTRLLVKQMNSKGQIQKIDNQLTKQHSSRNKQYSSGVQNKKNTVRISQQLQNQFSISKPQADRQRALEKKIKKNAIILFNFYCRQQMELGGVITFDRLSNQTSSMSLGKILTFAKAMNLYSETITILLVTNTFKKVAKGKKIIEFNEFWAFLRILSDLDKEIYQRTNLICEDIRKNLKYVKLPFNTKDIKPRQKVAVRNFSKKLTGHSGKMADNLFEQIVTKKRKFQNESKIKQSKKLFNPKKRNSQIISQEDLFSYRRKGEDLSVDLSFIGSIVQPQEDDDEYLGGQLFDHISAGKKRAPGGKGFVKKDAYKSVDLLNSRKRRVISDLKERVKELQRSQIFENKNRLIKYSINHSTYQKKQANHNSVKQGNH